MRLLSVVFLTLPVWTQVAAVPPYANAEPGTAVVAGVVLDRVTGAPVRKAMVRIWGGQAVNVFAITGAEGRFLIRDLDAGSYQLRVEHSQYPSDNHRLQRERIRRVEVKDGEEKTDIEFRLTPGASISGRVVDESGKPVVWCSISLLRFIIDGGKKKLRSVDSTQTNERGEYHTGQMPPGHYFVRARLQRRLPAARPFAPPDAIIPVALETYPTLYYPGVTAFRSAVAIELRPGLETRGIDFELPRIPATEVVGRITAPGSGWAGREYRVRLVARDELMGGEAESFRTATRKNAKRFRFVQAIPPGSYWLDLEDDGDARRYSAHEAVEVVAGPPLELIVSLTPSFSVRGRVVIEANETRRRTVGSISLLPTDHRPRWFQVSAKPDDDGTFLLDDGTFLLDNVLPGRWELSVSLNRPGYVKSVRAGGREIDPTELTIPVGGIPELVIEIGTRTAGFSCTADSEAGWVVLLPVSKKRPWPMLPESARGRDGHFEFGAVPPGAYHLFAIPAGTTGTPYDLLKDSEILEAVIERATAVALRADDKITAAAPLIPADVFVRPLVQ